MSAQLSSPVLPSQQAAAGSAPGEAVVSVGWRIEGASAAPRAVPYLVRGHPERLDADVRYAVPLTPAWHRP